mmetsp:Transcript_125541/g.313686  ORF Transcript_125541/g.313686 Transcript_125541/m.313686 type:complete len:238 (+) Transcript_125541:60-773(+)
MDGAFECPVCMETNAEEQALPCAHVFCHICVRRLALSRVPRCPMCREEFQTTNVEWTTAPLALNQAIQSPEQNQAIESPGRHMSREEWEVAQQVERQHLIRHMTLGTMSREDQAAALEAVGIPRPFACALACKVVVSGRRRTSKWVQCDSKEFVFVAQELFSVLEFCRLEDAMGWTFDFSDGSSYVHNPPLLRYRACPNEDVRQHGLVNAEDPLAVPNRIFPNPESWWVLRADAATA